jgi:hypothetical protein
VRAGCARGTRKDSERGGSRNIAKWWGWIPSLDSEGWFWRDCWNTFLPQFCKLASQLDLERLLVLLLVVSAISYDGLPRC